MPHSFGTFDRVVESLVRQIAPASLLDIGCGAGKYGVLLRALAPECRRIGIEVEASYIERFRLNDIYHEVRLGEAARVLAKNPRETFDLVVIGDCIEHMPKSVGLDLLNYLTYRSKFILVLAPEFIIQHDVQGVAEEAHVSVWSEHDFLWHDRWAWDNCWMMGLYLLRGYVGSPLIFETVVNTINAQQIPLTEGMGSRVIRPARLNARLRMRHDLNAAGERVIFRPL